ncbi:hypothetical protein ACFW08_02375 [Streptomyces sp. NPDC058960]|uniref:hypothetical protein n=1 Tax=Streptomyces sp. NPDC058960 TaxID=3346679 RepID=UPI0036B12C0C
MTTRTSRFPGSGTLIEETRLKGKVEDILRILDLRGIDVPEATRERIATCTDLDTLSTWFDRAPTVAHAEELFAQN